MLLSYTIENRYKVGVKLLLEKGTELEAKTSTGQTLLSYTAENRHEVVVKLLLEKGTKLETKTFNS